MALLFPQHTFLELTKTSFVSSCQNSSIAVYSARSIGGRPCATIYNCPFRRLALGAARPRRRGDRMKRHPAGPLPDSGQERGSIGGFLFAVYLPYALSRLA